MAGKAWSSPRQTEPEGNELQSLEASSKFSSLSYTTTLSRVLITTQLQADRTALVGRMPFRNRD